MSERNACSPKHLHIQLLDDVCLFTINGLLIVGVNVVWRVVAAGQFVNKGLGKRRVVGSNLSQENGVSLPIACALQGCRSLAQVLHHLKEIAERIVACALFFVVFKEEIPPALSWFLVLNSIALVQRQAEVNSPRPAVGSLKSEGVVLEIEFTAHGVGIVLLKAVGKGLTCEAINLEQGSSEGTQAFMEP